MANKIAYIKVGRNSGTNISIKKMLEHIYHDYQVDTIDLLDLLKQNKYIILLNSLYILKEYGKDILLRKRSLKRSFGVTSYMLRKSSSLMNMALSKEKYKFSFQSMSNFAISIKDFPNFVYIDGTNLSNLVNPNFDKELLSSGLFKFRLEMEKAAYQGAKMVFTMSSFTKKSVIEHYDCDPEKVYCVYAGSNIGMNTEEREKDYSNKQILFVGVDWERKGGPELAQAFKKVLKVHPEAKLTIVGCKPEINMPNYEPVGRVQLDRVKYYYEKASVFCLPSRWEPFGIAFVEALSNKLPVIGTNICAIPDMIKHGENGYLVELGNIEQLADALINLLGDPGRCRTFGEKGYQIAFERYNWDKVGEKIRHHIDNVINST